MNAVEPPPPVRTFRDWVFCVIAVGLSLLLAVIWGTWISLRINAHPTGIAAGEEWTDPVSGTQITMIGWQVDRGDGKKDRINPQPEGTVYVTIAMRVKLGAEAKVCSFELLGERQQTWQQYIPRDGNQSSCSEEDMPNREGVLTSVIPVPETKLGEVMGVRFSQSMRVVQAPLFLPPAP